MSAPNIWTVAAILAATAKFLETKGSSSPRLDAELLLAKVLNLPRVQLYINFERVLADGELGQYRELVRRRAQCEPVAYILGQKEFYGLPFKVSPAVLIPRPETEHLVDAALALAEDFEGPLEVADLGCGSGAIALALAHKLPDALVSAVDISPEALEQAQGNAAALKLSGRVEFHQGDLLAPLAGRKFHLICANLPYIPSEEMNGLKPEVAAHEPHLALDGGPAGLGLIGRLLAAAPAQLRQGGRVLLEIWPESLPALATQARAAGLDLTECVRDLAGHNRIAVLKAAGSTE